MLLRPMLPVTGALPSFVVSLHPDALRRNVNRGQHDAPYPSAPRESTMKLLRFGERGRERPGCLDSRGSLRDLSGHIGDVTGEMLQPEVLRRLAALPFESLPRVADGERLGACLAGAGKFVCVGLNYRDHAAESGAPVPAEPILFMKATSCISGARDPVVIPPGATMVDWEVELGVVIGSTAKNVAPEEALRYVAGYCVVNDVSERGWQLHGTGQWVKGKSADTFGPIGPWLVTREEIVDPQNLRLWLSVNGEMRQNSSTAQMIFPVATLVSYISRFMSLQAGDVIATGTPAGVALGAKPPPYLKAGDRIRCGIDGLGEQMQAVEGS
jgi:2-keto-4-pentenoate hydratase/2-oxohepta-3-ene-1,7-dioic acid hydratase in catechol pathway